MNPSVSATSSASSLLSPADAAFTKGLRDSLGRQVSGARDYGGLLMAITDRLDGLLEQTTGDDGEPKCPSPWGPIECSTTTSDQAHTVRITGPAPGDRFEATAASPAEVSDIIGYVSALSAACIRIGEIHGRLMGILERTKELEREQASLRQQAEVTVDEHIRLLRQYNKTKDAGQMLIGLIADSRAVPVGSLYRDRDFGVSLDD